MPCEAPVTSVGFDSLDMTASRTRASVPDTGDVDL